MNFGGIAPCFIVGIERGEVDIVYISQGRDSQQQKYLQMSVFLMEKFIKLPVGEPTIWSLLPFLV